MKISALICYDIEFVEPARILAINGAQLLIVPTGNYYLYYIVHL